MSNSVNIKMYSTTLDCKEPLVLAEFYAKLMKWVVIKFDQEDNFVIVAPPSAENGSYPGITIQRNPNYIPPVWPEEPQAQQQMAHIDFAVDDMEGAVRYALDAGATKAAQQFSEHWTVMFDPAGHPFCLCNMKHVFDSPHFALL